MEFKINCNLIKGDVICLNKDEKEESDYNFLIEIGNEERYESVYLCKEKMLVIANKIIEMVGK